MGATAQLAQTSVEVVPGQAVSVEVRVRNTGTVVDQLTLSVMGDAAAWATVDPPTTSLLPGDEAVVHVWFRPPARPAPAAGPVPFAVRVESKEDPEGGVAEEGTVLVAPAPLVTVELTPRTGRGSRRVRYDLAADNLGNVPVRLSLEAFDASEQSRFRIDPELLEVPSGAAAFSRVVLINKRPFIRGNEKTRPFQMVATPNEGDPLTADGVVVQQSVVPKWAFKALAALVAAALLLAALWFTVLRPVIRSSAKDAVAGPVAEAKDAANASKLAAGQAQQAAQAASAAGGGGPVVTQPPGTVLIATDFVVEAGQTLTVPDGKTLNITDVVFGNPANDHGIVAVSRRGEVVLRLNLDNFRDLDYHFETPIVLQSGDKLDVAVTGCAAPDNSPCVDPKPSAYFSGTIG